MAVATADANARVEPAIAAAPRSMTDQERYIFDLKGYLVVRGALTPEHVAALNETIDRVERMSDDEVPPPVFVEREMRKSRDMGIHNVKELGEPFERLIALEPILSLVEATIGSKTRLNHDYALLRHIEGSRTYFRLGNTPVTAACQFRVHDGRFFSSMTKVVFPLTDQAIEDGCFSVVPGSHKGNFPNPFGNDPVDNVIREPVPCRAGDAVIFTEALTHGSEVNVTGKPRRTLYYAYSPSWMTGWTHRYTSSPALVDRVDERTRSLLALAQMAGQETRAH